MLGIVVGDDSAFVKQSNYLLNIDDEYAVFSFLYQRNVCASTNQLATHKHIAYAKYGEHFIYLNINSD